MPNFFDLVVVHPQKLLWCIGILVEEKILKIRLANSSTLRNYYATFFTVFFSIFDPPRMRPYPTIFFGHPPDICPILPTFFRGHISCVFRQNRLYAGRPMHSGLCVCACVCACVCNAISRKPHIRFF